MVSIEDHKKPHHFPELLRRGTISTSVEDLLKIQQVLGKKTKPKHMWCGIYCYKISSFSELTANSLENFWWEQKPEKTELHRFCFDYCIGGSLLFYPARKLLIRLLSDALIVTTGSVTAACHASPG